MFSSIAKVPSGQSQETSFLAATAVLPAHEIQATETSLVFKIPVAFVPAKHEVHLTTAPVVSSDVPRGDQVPSSQGGVAVNASF